MNNPAPGRFITLEGGEGTGKSTLQLALRDRLIAKGIEVVLTREPGGTPRAEAIRALVLNPPGGQPFSPLAEALLMNAARSDHLDLVIRPALLAGKWVVCDRFSDSTRVYQGVSGEVAPDVLLNLEGHVVNATRPDLTLILDLPVALAEERRVTRAGGLDVFEQRGPGFHQSVREAFLAIARSEPGRCRLIDAGQPAPLVAEAAWRLLAPLLQPKADCA